jgi:hypothetical protein
VLPTFALGQASQLGNVHQDFGALIAESFSDVQPEARVYQAGLPRAKFPISLNRLLAVARHRDQATQNRLIYIVHISRTATVNKIDSHSFDCNSRSVVPTAPQKS